MPLVIHNLEFSLLYLKFKLFIYFLSPYYFACNCEIDIIFAVFGNY